MKLIYSAFPDFKCPYCNRWVEPDPFFEAFYTSEKMLIAQCPYCLQEVIIRQFIITELEKGNKSGNETSK